MEIAKGIQHSDYLKLNLNDYSCPDWDTAIEYFKKRINERFIEPIRIFIESESDKQAIEKKYGFTILAIDFMLIETIQSFIEGKTETKSKSKKVFKRFLRKRKNFKDSELLTSRSLHCRGFKKQLEICAWKNCFIII